MIVKKNIKANFWIRLLATLIDLLLFIIFSIGTSFIVFNYKNMDFYTNNKIFKEIIFRVWLLVIILFIILEYILIPIILKGQTIGMLICKIKIIQIDQNRKLSKYIFDRQRLFALFWIFVFLSFMLISADGFIDAARGKKLNAGQKIILAIPSLLATIAINAQILIILSGISSTRLNWNDKLSRTQTVWKNKFEEIEDDEEFKNKLIISKRRELPKINWFK
ncbi:RDD family protein [Metamycoplasma auris]|uniref:RDD family protein n=1 Tax=Metamycoplasma auris TaxID=51363 RepID=A0A2W7HZB3_9BACT|nr:RDD family protein [Metamycoplasma auris]PZW00566.1 RDD family protein [Metamycoplasma auris]